MDFRISNSSGNFGKVDENKGGIVYRIYRKFRGAILRVEWGERILQQKGPEFGKIV